MYTKCPSCNTIYRVRPEQLAAADGKVRCGHCHAVFDGNRFLMQELPGKAKAAPARPAPRPEPPPPAPMPASASAAALPVKAPPPAAEDEADALPPLLRQPEPPPPRRGQALWLLGSLLLTLTLAGQYVWHQRNRLAEDPALRPWMEQLCELVDCHIPPRRDLDAFELRERDVRSHPGAQGALLLSGSFVNRAAFAQPYPDLEVVFKDTNERVVGARVFHPEEYLSTARGNALGSGAEAQLLLELQDPGARAVSFEFRFR